MTFYNDDIDPCKRHLALENDVQDTEVTEKMDAAYAYINDQLLEFTTVPLAAPGDLILLIEYKLAAGWFRAGKVEPEEGDDKWGQREIKEAKEMLQEYIKAKWKSTSDEDDLLAETGWHTYAGPSYGQDLG